MTAITEGVYCTYEMTIPRLMAHSQCWRPQMYPSGLPFSRLLGWLHGTGYAEWHTFYRFLWATQTPIPRTACLDDLHLGPPRNRWHALGRLLLGAR